VDVSVAVVAPQHAAGAAADEMPRKLPQNPAPPYPAGAYARGEQGRVTLIARIDAIGRVVELEIEQSSGFEELDRSALATVRMWQFVPARKGSDPVPCTVTVPIRFSIRAQRG
jgi:protein TonB